MATKTRIAALQALLLNNSKIENVYFGSKGDWQFHKRPGYSKKVSRDAVLEDDFMPEGIIDDSLPAQAAAPAVKLTPVADVLASISAATTEEELDIIADAEPTKPRATVNRAIDAQRQLLKDKAAAELSK